MYNSWNEEGLATLTKLHMHVPLECMLQQQL